MSPRAAARLEALGFATVFDYVEGKAGWGAAGLPLEGADSGPTRAGAHVRTDVPTCGAGERLAEVRARVAAAGWDTCVVVDAAGVVLGRLGRRALADGGDTTVEAAMTEGPSTVRPSARVAELAERMRRQDLASLPVTTGDGRFVGLLLREDAERAAAGGA